MSEAKPADRATLLAVADGIREDPTYFPRGAADRIEALAHLFTLEHVNALRQVVGLASDMVDFERSGGMIPSQEANPDRRIQRARDLADRMAAFLPPREG